MVDIEGFEDYCITKDGKVWSKDRIDAGGRRRKGRYLKAACKDGKYLTVTLMKDGKAQDKKIHRLVAENYIDNHENKPCVDHIDDNKLNNHVNNLQWVTISENNKKAWDNNRNTGNSKFIPEGKIYKKGNNYYIRENNKTRYLKKSEYVKYSIKEAT